MCVHVSGVSIRRGPTRDPQFKATMDSPVSIYTIRHSLPPQHTYTLGSQRNLQTGKPGDLHFVC